MVLYRIILIFLLYLCHQQHAAAFSNGELSYSNLLRTLKSRVDSELKLKSEILNSRHLFDDIDNLDRRPLLIRAYSYLHEENFDLSSTAASFNVSELCLNHTKILLAALFSGETWALKMLDAMGKIPSDVLEGNLIWYGSYDECVKVQALVNTSRSGSMVQETPFVGKYCLTYIPFGSADPNNMMGALFSVLKIGSCLPDSCSDNDAKALINTILSLVPLGNSSLSAASSICQENELQYDTKAIIVLVVCSLFIVVIATGTMYDIVVIQLPKQRQSQEEIGTQIGDNSTYQEQTVNQEEYKPLLGDSPTLTKVEKGFGVVGEVLLSFSVYTNGKKLLSTKQPPGSLEAVHGIRFLSMTWVILGHLYVTGIYNGANLATYYPEILNRWTYQAIVNALVSVDSFFTLSGLLMSFLILKEMKKNNGKVNWFMYYFHRFWRLTPPNMLVMMIYVPLFRYFSNGPAWPQKGVEKDFCKASWWSNLLYLNNFLYIGNNGVGQDEGCMSWTWYLANDMQFYVISPILFVPLFYSEVIGIILCLVVLLAVTLTPGIISSVNNMPVSIFTGQPDNGTYYTEYYSKPYCRMGPYIIGILTGYILHKTNCRFRMNKYLNLAGWIIAAGLACAVLYGLYNPVNGHHILSVDVSALYNATHSTVWGACVCWVIFACVTGHGGFVNTILSWSALVPLSRLTYCAYLVHPVLMFLYYFSLRQPLYFTDLTMVWLFLAFLMASYGVAFVVSLAFESPMMALEKVIFKRGDKKTN